MKMSSVPRVGGVVLGMIVAVGISTHRASAQTDPQVGTWVLDVTKSKYSPGPAPQSQCCPTAAPSCAAVLASLLSAHR